MIPIVPIRRTPGEEREARFVDRGMNGLASLRVLEEEERKLGLRILVASVATIVIVGLVGLGIWKILQ